MPLSAESAKSAELEELTEEASDRWAIDLSLTLWTANLEGLVGVGGLVAPVDLSFGDILDNLNFAIAGTADIRREDSRVGLLLEGMYLDVGPGIDDVPLPFFSIDGITVEQVMASAALYYRVAEWDRGHFDVFGGARYMYVNSGLHLSPNSSGIAETSNQLSGAVVDELTAQATAAVAAAKPIVVDQLQRAARAKILAGIIGGTIDPDKINPATIALAKAIAAEQTAAIGSSARKKASKAVTRLQKKLAREIDSKITRAIPDYVGGSASWVDPFVGMRAQHYLSDRIYVAALADIGGFGVGSELSWNAGGGVGVQVHENVALEMFYRYMSIDYNDDILFDVDMSGLFLGLKMSF
jgi:opacity protein-like surface antigen